MTRETLNDVVIVLSMAHGDIDHGAVYPYTIVHRYGFVGNEDDLKRVIAHFPGLFVEGGKMW